jgi:hypothetical protein
MPDETPSALPAAFTRPGPPERRPLRLPAQSPTPSGSVAVGSDLPPPAPAHPVR